MAGIRNYRLRIRIVPTRGNCTGSRGFTKKLGFPQAEDAIRGIAYPCRSGRLPPSGAYEGNYGWSRGYYWVILYCADDSDRIREDRFWMSLDR